MKNLKLAVLALLAAVTLHAVPAHALVYQEPDLMPTAVAVDDNGFIKVRISNLGTSCCAFKIRVWQYASSQIIDVPAVPACTYGAAFITTNIKAVAGWPVFVTADCTNLIKEASEANNTRALAY